MILSSLNSWIILIVLFATTKYHLRFNIDKKFHDLESTNKAQAIKAKEQAEKTLADRDSELDFTKAAAQLAEAAARIKTIQKLRKNK